MNSVSLQYPDRLRAARERLIGTKITDEALNVCISGLQRVEGALRRPLRIVVLGESNAGKTSVTDLFIGRGLLPTSVVSNTGMPVLISYANKSAVYGIDHQGTRIRIDSNGDDALTDVPYRALQVALPIERLRSYQLLDTPPFVSPATFVADADIVIWCTVATRAWTESERAAWAALPKRASRYALLVATHKDGLDSEDDIRHVTTRLKSLTSEHFRDVVLVDAEGVRDGSDPDPDADATNGADTLRLAIARLAADVMDRKTRKAEKIVRRLARLTFHHFASDVVRPEAVEMLMRWETHARQQLQQLKDGRQTVPDTIEALLVAYAACAEKLRPGVVRGEDTITGSTSRALTSPIRWPQQTTAAARLVETLASDLTGLLRMLAGHSTFEDPAVKAEYQSARSIVLALADLDGAFDALGRMLGSSLVSKKG